MEPTIIRTSSPFSGRAPRFGAGDLASTEVGLAARHRHKESAQTINNAATAQAITAECIRLLAGIVGAGAGGLRADGLASGTSSGGATTAGISGCCAFHRNSAL